MVRVSIIFISIACFILLASSCNNGSHEYHSALGDVPARIDPADSHINYALHIIKQLNEPLFIYNTANRPVSNMLDRWSSSPDGRMYELCIKSNVEFSNGSLLTTAILEQNIMYFQRKGYLRKSVDRLERTDKCVNISYEVSYPQFISDMMSYKTSIVDPATRGQNVVVGISPYYVADINPKYIHLRSKKDVRFRDVYFHYWRPAEGWPLYKYDDINLIFERDIPGNIEKYLNRYDITMLKTEDVIINHPSKEVRRYLFNCINADVIRRIVHPEKVSFAEIGSIVPLGLPGAVEGRVTQTCPVKPMAKRADVRMLTFYEDSLREFQDYFDGVFKNLNIQVRVEGIDANELVGVMSSKDKDYDLTIVGLDAEQPDSGAMFGFFVHGENQWTRVENSLVEFFINEYYESASDVERADFITSGSRYAHSFVRV